MYVMYTHACIHTYAIMHVLSTVCILHNYLHQGGNVFTPDGWFVCMSVNNVTQKLVDEYS